MLIVTGSRKYLITRKSNKVLINMYIYLCEPTILYTCIKLAKRTLLIRLIFRIACNMESHGFRIVQIEDTSLVVHEKKINNPLSTRFIQDVRQISGGCRDVILEQISNHFQTHSRTHYLCLDARET